MGERVDDWTDTYQTDFVPTEHDRLLHDLAKRYHEECEAYDRTVCTGPVTEDGILPVNHHELALVNRNSSNVLRDILRSVNGVAQRELLDAIRKYRGGYRG